MKQQLREAFPGLADAYGLLRYGKTEVPVWLDLKRTWQQSAPLRQLRSASMGRVLVCFATESIFEIKVLMSIAGGLLVRGWGVGVLFPSINSLKSGFYCRAFGASHVMSLADVELTRHERRAVNETASLIAGAEWTVPTLKAYEFEKVWLGPQLVAALSRRTYSGRVNLQTKETSELLATVAPDALAAVFRAKRLISEWDPDLLICMEPNALGTTATVDTAITHEIGVIQVTQPWRDDAFICKRLTAKTRRMHPSSVDSEAIDGCERNWTPSRDTELDKVLSDRYSGRWTLQARNQPNTHEVTRDQLVDEFDFDHAKKLVVVFCHVLWDANLFYGEDLFEDYGDWFIQTVKAASANESVNWLIKLHPANIWKRQLERVEGELDEIQLIAQHIGRLPKHVKLMLPTTEVSSLSLYRWADCGVTVRGTAGLEMPCFGKPVITAGSGRYSSLGFTIDPSTPTAYLEALRNVQRVEPLGPDKTRKARIHAHAALVLKPWRFSGLEIQINSNSKGHRTLDHNVTLRLRTRDDFLTSPELRQWIEWAIANKDVDLLSTGSLEEP